MEFAWKSKGTTCPSRFPLAGPTCSPVSRPRTYWLAPTPSYTSTSARNPRRGPNLLPANERGIWLRLPALRTGGKQQFEGLFLSAHRRSIARDSREKLGGEKHHVCAGPRQLTRWVPRPLEKLGQLVFRQDPDWKRNRHCVGHKRPPLSTGLAWWSTRTAYWFPLYRSMITVFSVRALFVLSDVFELNSKPIFHV